MSGESEEIETEEEPESAAESETEQPEEGVQEGEFVRVAYTARTVEDDMLVDTTDQEIAEEEGVAEDRTVEPRVVKLGEGHLFEAVEDAIIGSEVGSSGTVVVETAFGEYDKEEVRTVSANKIPEDDRYPGAQVQIDGQQGRLETIIGGRARVDYNHPLAGKDIEYEYESLEIVEDDLERATAILGMFLDLDLEIHIQTDEVEEEQLVESDEEETEEAEEDDEQEPEYETVTTEKRTLYIESTPQLAMNQQWMFQKNQLANQLMDQVGFDRVIVQEIIDGSAGMGMGMGGLGGMGGDIEEELEDADVDVDEILEEIEGEGDAEAETDVDAEADVDPEADIEPDAE